MISARPSRKLGTAIAVGLVSVIAPPVFAQDWSLMASFNEAIVPDGAHVEMVLDGDLLFIAICDGEAGTVRMHQRHQGGLDQWGILGSIQQNEPWFGRSIALCQGLLAIGSPAASTAGPFTGDVRIYQVDLEPGAEALQPLEVIALDDQTANDRFGHTVHWLGDTLAVSAVGRAVSRSFGVVYLYAFDESGAQPIGSLPFSSSSVQVPFIRWFGATIAHDGDRLALAAPFTGFEPSYPRQNTGSVHIYRRDGIDPAGWALDTAWADTRVAPDASCSFAFMELGRWGLAFDGDELIFDQATPYDGVPGSTFEPWSLPPPGPGCDACGLRIAQRVGDLWDLTGSIAPAQADPAVQRETRGWTVKDGALYANWINPTDTTWTTAVHRRDQGGPGNWGVETDIPATDPCDRSAGPLAVSGSRIARLVTRRGSGCGVAEGSVLYRVEILGQ